MRFLNSSEAAKRLGVSAKALRLYEQHGLVAPSRTLAGWRAYGPEQMARAAEIVALRRLGLSLAQIARALGGEVTSLEPALAAHQGTLEDQIRELVGTVEKVRGMRADLVRGQAPATGELARLLQLSAELAVTFELPWPWGGEPFELRDIRPLTYIIGPLGSGKTRLARCLAETLPNAPSSVWGGRRMARRKLARSATPTLRSNCGLIRSSTGWSMKAPWSRMRLSPCSSAWKPRDRTSWSSTWSNKGWTTPRGKR
jgi:DNA-binding transcriptional MerR regulator